MEGQGQEQSPIKPFKRSAVQVHDRQVEIVDRIRSGAPPPPPTAPRTSSLKGSSPATTPARPTSSQSQSHHQHQQLSQWGSSSENNNTSNSNNITTNASFTGSRLRPPRPSDSTHVATASPGVPRTILLGGGSTPSRRADHETHPGSSSASRSFPAFPETPKSVDLTVAGLQAADGMYDSVASDTGSRSTIGGRAGTEQQEDLAERVVKLESLLVELRRGGGGGGGGGGGRGRGVGQGGGEPFVGWKSGQGAVGMMGWSGSGRDQESLAGYGVERGYGGDHRWGKSGGSAEGLRGERVEGAWERGGGGAGGEYARLERRLREVEERAEVSEERERRERERRKAAEEKARRAAKCAREEEEWQQSLLDRVGASPASQRGNDYSRRGGSGVRASRDAGGEDDRGSNGRSRAGRVAGVLKDGDRIGAIAIDDLLAQKQSANRCIQELTSEVVRLSKQVRQLTVHGGGPYHASKRAREKVAHSAFCTWARAASAPSQADRVSGVLLFAWHGRQRRSLLRQCISALRLASRRGLRRARIARSTRRHADLRVLSSAMEEWKKLVDWGGLTQDAAQMRGSRWKSRCFAAWRGKAHRRRVQEVAVYRAGVRRRRSTLHNCMVAWRPLLHVGQFTDMRLLALAEGMEERAQIRSLGAFFQAWDISRREKRRIERIGMHLLYHRLLCEIGAIFDVLRSRAMRARLRPKAWRFLRRCQRRSSRKVFHHWKEQAGVQGRVASAHQDRNTGRNSHNLYTDSTLPDISRSRSPTLSPRGTEGLPSPQGHLSPHFRAGSSGRGVDDLCKEFQQVLTTQKQDLRLLRGEVTLGMSMRLAQTSPFASPVGVVGGNPSYDEEGAQGDGEEPTGWY